MSLTINSYPPRVALVGNGIYLKLTTDNLYDTPGQACVRSMNRVGSIAVNESIVFEFGEQSITMVAKNIPDDSGTQLSAGGSSLVHAQQIAANYNISSCFHVSVSGQKITLTSRLKSTDYNLVLTFNTSAYEEDPLSYDGISPIEREAFGVVLQIVNTANIIGIDKLEPSTDGIVIFNVAEYLKGLFSVEKQYPESGAIMILRNDSRIIYQMRWAEAWGDPISVKALTSSDEYYALPGSVSPPKLRELESASQNWWQRMAYEKPFLSNAPALKLTEPGIPEKLYFAVWYNPTGNTLLSITLFFTDGTSATIANYSSISLAKYDVIELQVGTIGLDIIDYVATNYSTKTLASYEVWLTNNSLIVSEKRKYVLDTRFRPWKKVFLFINAFGFWEVLRTTGKSINLSNTDRVLSERTEAREFDANFRSVFQSDSYNSQNIKSNTGYFKNVDSVRWANEFFSSPDVWEIRNNLLVPIRIITNSIETDVDGDTRYSFAFEYELIGSSNIITGDNSEQFLLGEYGVDYSNDYMI